MPSFDWDGDGLDEVLSTLTSTYAVYDGDNATLLLNRWTDGACNTPGQIFSQPVPETALPVVADFLGAGREQILYGKNEGTMALLDFSGDPIWHTPYYDGMHFQTLQGVGDLDGDGQLDILVAGHCGRPRQEIQKYDATTGAVQWTLPMPTACEWPGPKAVAMGDLDGDGRDEALVMNGNVLHAIGEGSRGKGEFLWRATFEPHFGWTEHGYPVIADVDGTGKPQILMNTTSGYLYGLGAGE